MTPEPPVQWVAQSGHGPFSPFKPPHRLSLERDVRWNVMRRVVHGLIIEAKRSVAAFRMTGMATLASRRGVRYYREAMP